MATSSPRHRHGVAELAFRPLVVGVLVLGWIALRTPFRQRDDLVALASELDGFLVRHRAAFPGNGVLMMSPFDPGLRAANDKRNEEFDRVRRAMLVAYHDQLRGRVMQAIRAVPSRSLHAAHLTRASDPWGTNDLERLNAVLRYLAVPGQRGAYEADWVRAADDVRALVAQMSDMLAQRQAGRSGPQRSADRAAGATWDRETERLFLTQFREPARTTFDRCTSLGMAVQGQRRAIADPRSARQMVELFEELDGEFDRISNGAAVAAAD